MDGGQTPEELETLLEDAVLLGDADAVAGLFQPGGMLVMEGAPRLPGRGQIREAAAARACAVPATWPSRVACSRSGTWRS